MLSWSIVAECAHTKKFEHVVIQCKLYLIENDNATSLLDWKTSCLDLETWNGEMHLTHAITLISITFIICMLSVCLYIEQNSSSEKSQSINKHWLVKFSNLIMQDTHDYSIEHTYLAENCACSFKFNVALTLFPVLSLSIQKIKKQTLSV